MKVNVTEFRNHLPSYLGRVMRGEEVLLTSRGQVVARMSPAVDERLAAKELLASLRRQCTVGDVISPIGEEWEADHDPS